ncbi:hypothetical protein ACTXK0_05250 [Corynebacterium variabile]|uniref:hypothetical protein n=1 Tax=Corynebacterium variabile TaxID=1727 RepID=UPI003FCEF56F
METSTVYSFNPHGADRVDAAMIVRAALQLALPDADLALDRDASYGPTDTPLTVLSVATLTAPGIPSRRWRFEVTVSTNTTAADIDAAMSEAERVGDALLSLTEYNGVRISSVASVMEPLPAAPHSPTGDASVVATYSLILRRN